MRNREWLCAGMMLCWGLWASAGNLNPSAPPTAGTMKPLDQIEPRIAVNAENTPGDTSFVFRITQPGSYYLTAPISLSENKAGIQIAANNVTLDLMGFQIETTYPNSEADGIVLEGKNIVIKNGTIQGFRKGITNTYSNDEDIQILAVRILNCRNQGIYLNMLTGDTGAGGGIFIRDCVAEHNGLAGIQVANAAQVENCIANRNQIGIVSGVGGKIVGCTASYNTEAGISTGENTIVENSLCRRNGTYGIESSSICTIRGNSTANNGVYGIYAGIGSVVAENSACNNQNYGIRASSSCVVSGNTAYNNQAGGIYAMSGATVVRNTAYLNKTYGIFASGCLVDQNSCVNNNQSGGGYTNLYASSCTLGTNHAP